MFRKFLKALPKADGKSAIDWQEYYIKETIHLWKPEDRLLLNELVSPVPKLFRDVAKEAIAGKIGELLFKANVKELSQKLIIEGYILATPKRDHKWLFKKLQEMGIKHECKS